MRVSIFKWILQKRRLLKEFNELRAHNRKLSGTKMVLNQRERIMILDALLLDEHKFKVEVAHKYFIRKMYLGLLAKFKAGIKEGF